MGRALPITVEELCQERAHWRALLRNPAKLRAEFGPLPSANIRPFDKEAFAMKSRFGNTLPVHLEFRGRYPRAVIQPITGRELLIALAWLDLVREAQFKICRKCGIEYTVGGTKFCDWKCEHASTVARWRKKRKSKRNRGR
jgi:hypothetical protein